MAAMSNYDNWSTVLSIGTGILSIGLAAVWQTRLIQGQQRENGVASTPRDWLHHFIQASSLSSRSSATVVAAAVTGGVLLFAKAFSECKIGITRTLGLPVVSHHDNNDDATKAKGVGRRLGLLERWYIAHTRSGNHNGLTLAVEFQAESVPTTEELRLILHRVSLRHPMLRARIFRDGVDGMDSTQQLKPVKQRGPRKTNKWQRLWGDDLYLWISNDTKQSHVRIVEEWEMERGGSDCDDGEGNGLRQVLEEQNARTWHDEDPSLPLWRATLIRWKDSKTKFALVVSFHHVITDGVGATAVVQAIVEESGRQKNPPSDDEILCCDIPAPMEDILDTVPRLRHIWRPLLLDALPPLSFFLSPRVFSGRPKKDVTTHFADNMACFELCCNQKIELFRQSCQARGTTMHSALVAALCKAIAIHVDQVQIMSKDYSWSKGRLWNGDIRFRIGNPVNERSRCQPPSKESDLCCRLSTTDVVFRAGPYSNMKTLGQDYSQLLHMHRKESPMIVGLAAFISGDWLKFSTKRVRHNRGDAVDSIDATNLGFVSIETPPGGFQEQGMWFVHGRQNPAPALKACWVTTSGGSLNLVLSSLPQHFTREDLLSVGSIYKVELRMEYLKST